MSRIRGKDTKPELLARSLVHRMGFRFRLHRADLPGKPDLAFVSRRKVIFVHGCFWHGHTCRRGQRPTSNTKFWGAKLAKNKAWDNGAVRRLRRDDWGVLVLWECQLHSDALRLRLERFLGE